MLAEVSTAQRFPIVSVHVHCASFVVSTLERARPCFVLLRVGHL